jgi:hypothetical protein
MTKTRLVNNLAAAITGQNRVHRLHWLMKCFSTCVPRCKFVPTFSVQGRWYRFDFSSEGVVTSEIVLVVCHVSGQC